MLQLLLTLAAGLSGYLLARNFVRNRLRFVDAIHGLWFPLVAGTLGFLLAWPLALLPLVSAGPAAIFGLGVGLGSATGARQVRRADDPRRRLTP
ncbi:MAG TPA: hypothetical protein VFN40_04540 [Gemmatimonadales bacterium]|jgi:hypothetical protein|nr:hypothetical protein [Gemmatimonadales bacterium]